jgi:hypothetical protein
LRHNYRPGRTASCRRRDPNAPHTAHDSARFLVHGDQVEQLIRGNQRASISDSHPTATKKPESALAPPSARTRSRWLGGRWSRGFEFALRPHMRRLAADLPQPRGCLVRPPLLAARESRCRRRAPYSARKPRT